MYVLREMRVKAAVREWYELAYSPPDPLPANWLERIAVKWRVLVSEMFDCAYLIETEGESIEDLIAGAGEAVYYPWPNDPMSPGGFNKSYRDEMARAGATLEELDYYGGYDD